jgi:hypothetical protein
MVGREFPERRIKLMPQAAPALTPAAAPPGAPARPQIKPLEQRRLKLICSSASDVGNWWAIVVPSDVTLEAVLEPAFWSNVAPQLRVADIIDVHSDGRDFYAKLYVREVGRARVAVALVQRAEFEALETVNELASYRVKYGGPHSKWAVERVSDRKIVKDGCDTREDVETALKAIEASLARKVA